MKTRILIREGEYRLAKAGVMDARIDAEELLCFITGWDRVVLFLNKEKEADKETEKEYFELIEKRAQRIPLQHITGVQEFMGFEFMVGPEVLIPRQDTETLVTEAAKTIRESRKELRDARAKASFLKKIRKTSPCDVLDLCCGSGAIGISIAKICEDVSVTATDINEKALALAIKNAQKHHVDIEFLHGDMFEALTGGDRITKSGSRSRRKGSDTKAFDMIVSNPPYIKTNMIAMLQEEVKSHEPIEALDGGRDGLDFYRIIVDQAAKWLKPDGYLIMEIGFDQGEELRKLVMDSHKYTTAEVIRDLPGRDRVVKCQKL